MKNNKSYACPVCAASMIGECRLCGYKEKKIGRITSGAARSNCKISVRVFMQEIRDKLRRAKENINKTSK